MNYELLIQNFLNTMEKELNLIDFEIVKQNIRNIDIDLLEKNKNENANGSYSPTGVIAIHKKNDKGTFYHELFHAASSYYNEDKMEFNSGFHHQNVNEKKDIGIGINEGYTELLTERYFDSNNESGYSNELHYAKLVEHIIGREKMQSYYLESSLNDLIMELCKYNSLENTLKFLENMDKFIILGELKDNKIKSFSETTSFVEYSKWFDELDEYINKTYNELNQFIVETHFNKLKSDPDYEKNKDELISMMSTPLSFNFKKYHFDIKSQFSKNNNI